MGRPRIDLHTHSTVSDGTDTPAGVVTAAGAAGLDVVALTDHDTIGGLGRGGCGPTDRRGAGAWRGVLVRGCRRAGRSPRRHPGAPAGLPVRPRAPGDRRRAGPPPGERGQRLRRMTERMAAAGFPVDIDTVFALLPDGASAGRPHLARALVAAGCRRARSTRRSRRCSTPGARTTSRRSTRPRRRAVEMVRAAGGVTVFAHPLARRRGRVVDERVIVELADGGARGPGGRSPGPRPGRPRAPARARGRPGPRDDRIQRLPRHEQDHARSAPKPRIPPSSTPWLPAPQASTSSPPDRASRLRIGARVATTPCGARVGTNWRANVAYWGARRRPRSSHSRASPYRLARCPRGPAVRAVRRTTVDVWTRARSSGWTPSTPLRAAAAGPCHPGPARDVGGLPPPLPLDLPRPARAASVRRSCRQHAGRRRAPRAAGALRRCRTLERTPDARRRARRPVLEQRGLPRRSAGRRATACGRGSGSPSTSPGAGADATPLALERWVSVADGADRRRGTRRPDRPSPGSRQPRRAGHRRLQDGPRANERATRAGRRRWRSTPSAARHTVRLPCSRRRAAPSAHR